MSDFSLLPRGGVVADGTGAPLVERDVAVAGGRVGVVAPGTVGTADADGIEMVIVGGQVVRDGEVVEARPGRVPAC